MPLNIKIENFEGPFDLLLHLIKKNEMDIYDIKIYEITNQYLDYIRNMGELDLEVTSEFIVIAATLIEIKSKMLLPKVAKDDETACDEAQEDPRNELVLKLVEYKRFKAASQFLGKRLQSSGVTFGKKPEIIEEKKKEVNMEEVLKDVTILKLFYIFNDLMNGYKNRMNDSTDMDKNVAADAYKIEDKMLFLRERARLENGFKFSAVALECESKMEVVVTFIALLELIKLRIVKVSQDCNFKDIYIEGVNSYEQEH